MAYLGKYIQQLLQKKEDVILPGFGSLKVVKSTGIKDSSGKLYPPGLIVKFDPEHPKDDNKLASLYADGEGYNWEEASQQVLELVDAIKFRLDKGEKFDLEDLGEFSRDDDNRIHFKKSNEWILDPDNFGLEPLELIELEDEMKEEVEFEKIEEERGATEPDLHETGRKDIIKKPPVNKWKIIWIVVIGLIAVLVTLLLIPTGNDGIEFSKEGIIIRDSESDNEGPEKSEQINKREEIIDQPKDESNIQKETKESVIDVSPEQSVIKYYIIAGSFQNLINASEMRDKLIADGYPAEIIYTENRLYRVSIKSYLAKDAANNDLERIKRESGIERVWILAR